MCSIVLPGEHAERQMAVHLWLTATAADCQDSMSQNENKTEDQGNGGKEAAGQGVSTAETAL